MPNDDVSYEGAELVTLRMSDVLAAMDRLRERFAAQGERVWVLEREEFWEVAREDAFKADKPEVSSADMVAVLFFLRQAEVVDDPTYPSHLADVLRFISYREEYCGD
ncbi:hypothetical protein EV667_0709 [Ancylobacter aquaticus]|uniref:Uncharacterized protein n=1 Tax=Ancylobacter aquaticus TaxID=100 RepID=A0A4R1I9M1_ANCAQ|nr:hypothetical protein [Ancylobacter aquaticus]TCK30615.1 hypothetical protein EV667_0709 [Ancylobacter aquaticus]